MNIVKIGENVNTCERLILRQVYEHYNDKYRRELGLDCPHPINLQIFLPYLV